MYRDRQFQNTSLDDLEDSEDIDSASRILQNFRKKNARVFNKLFHMPSAKDAGPDKNQSYGLRFVSMSEDTDKGMLANDKSDEENRLSGTNNGNTSKEIQIPETQEGDKQQEDRNNVTPFLVRALSPHTINQKSLNELNEEKIVPEKSSTCRSLFSSDSSKSIPLPTFNVISSTPMRRIRKSFCGNLFGTETPIAKHANDNQAIRNKSDEIIRTPTVTSIANIEQDLRQQYQNHPIEENTKANNKTSQEVTEANTSSSRIEIEEITDVCEPVRPQNTTDMNQIRMVETPLVRPNKQINVKSAKQNDALRQAQVTSDESGITTPANIRECSIQIETITTQEYQSVMNIPRSCANVVVERIAGNKSPNGNNKNVNNHVGDLAKADANLKNANANDSLSKTVPGEVVQSFRNLRKRSANEATISLDNSNQNPKLSMKISAPSRKRKICKINETTKSYINLTNDRKKKSSKAQVRISRTRQLYADVSYSQEQIVSQEENLNSSPEEIESEEIITNPNHQPSLTTNKNTTIDADHVSNQQQSIEDETNNLQEKEQFTITKTSSAKVSKEKSKGKSSKTETKSSKTRKERSKRQKHISMEENDENMHEDENKCNNIRYDPYKMGCTRLGLRPRRYARPYWTTDKDIYITYTDFSVKQLKAEQMLRREMGKDHVSQKQIFHSDYHNFLKPTDKLKMYKESKHSIKKRTKTFQKTLGSKANSTVSSKISTTSTSATSGSSVKSSSLLSILNAETTVQPSSQRNIPHFMLSEHFDMADVSNLKFRDCGNGLYFGSYIKNKNDGIIKLISGGHKPKARSKTSFLKFLVLHGKVEFKIENEIVMLGEYGYLNIKPGSYYEIRNNSDDVAVVSFVRIERQYSVIEDAD
ncbi:CLUMA_CG012627, isoform A [Clunio marinus]|uniref:CLUMA_CG012627, isoform A n=1 Tax=Clunio marinus TaxID=568069 RepID=A0A1J1IGD3_9DIPT|nr:CLUMA_CG012627, isoform A [Clunio marinus]